MRLQILHFRLTVVLALATILQAGPPLLNASAQQPQQPPAKAAPPPETPQQSAPTDDALSLSDQVIQDVLEPLRTGMETQNIKQVMSIFDKGQMSNYGDLQEQVSAFLRQYQEVRFRYQILQATAQNDHASATAELDMDAMPYQASMIQARRSVQMRFQLKQEPKGWRVVGFSPSDFFSLSNYSRSDTQ
jgi:hypothetical protein